MKILKIYTFKMVSAELKNDLLSQEAYESQYLRFESFKSLRLSDLIGNCPSHLL